MVILCLYISGIFVFCLLSEIIIMFDYVFIYLEMWWINGGIVFIKVDLLKVIIL